MNRTTQGVSCEVCNVQRAPGEIHTRPSRILPKQMLFICNRCDANRKEPREFVILVAKHYGLAKVRDLVLERKYDGPAILLEEIV